VLNVGAVGRLPAWRSRNVEPFSLASERQLAMAGGVSLVCWVTAITAGRMIGYW
jgi:hypothetical protein